MQRNQELNLLGFSEKSFKPGEDAFKGPLKNITVGIYERFKGIQV